jgi:hypothetical protein
MGFFSMPKAFFSVLLLWNKFVYEKNSSYLYHVCTHDVYEKFEMNFDACSILNFFFTFESLNEHFPI